ncbi:outer membrane protein assembly factor BamD [Variibacter gotjawalensis]|nr:outer membrane protein assembly factor BamD [Variibacter gotjawalensis]
MSRNGTARMVRQWRGLVLALSLPLLAGCSSFGMPDFFGKADTTVPDAPADRLYNEGLYLLQQKKDYKAAAKRFEEVDRQHPYTEYSRKSLLMSAYSYYEGKEYPEAVMASKRYLSLHPSSPDAAYAQFIMSSAYYDQIPDPSRDQKATERAIKELEDVARKYPNTEYAVSAKRKLDIARDTIAAKEMAIGRFYQEKRDFTGAINRFKVVVTQYQTSRHVEEALMRLAESYMALGIVGEAQTAAAVLGHNFPQSRWYRDAYQLVSTGGAEPTENRGSWISRAFRKTGLG